MVTIRLALRAHTVPFDGTPWHMYRAGVSMRSDTPRGEHLAMALIGLVVLGTMLLGVSGHGGLGAATQVLDVDALVVLT